MNNIIQSSDESIYKGFQRGELKQVSVTRLERITNKSCQSQRLFVKETPDVQDPLSIKDF